MPRQSTGLTAAILTEWQNYAPGQCGADLPWCMLTGTFHYNGGFRFSFALICPL
jgi:hypothetical protein